MPRKAAACRGKLPDESHTLALAHTLRVAHPPHGGGAGRARECWARLASATMTRHSDTDTDTGTTWAGEREVGEGVALEGRTWWSSAMSSSTSSSYTLSHTPSVPATERIHLPVINCIYYCMRLDIFYACPRLVCGVTYCMWLGFINLLRLDMEEVDLCRSRHSHTLGAHTL